MTSIPATVGFVEVLSETVIHIFCGKVD